MKIDSFQQTIAGKWKCNDGNTYTFLLPHDLMIQPGFSENGRWELLGSEENITLRMWTPLENGQLSPRFYNVHDLSSKSFMLARAFGGSDTLLFSSPDKKVLKSKNLLGKNSAPRR